MPRHHFRFPREVREIVRKYVDERVSKIDPRRYNQEPKYVTALLRALEGIVYEDKGFIQFKCTDFDDRGAKSAESILGADFAITATISNDDQEIDKVICVQAKLGTISSLNTKEFAKLTDQIGKIKKFTRAPKIMEIEEIEGRRYPKFVSGNRIVAGETYESTHLSDYIIRRVLTTLDGDTRPGFVEAMQDSSIPALRVKAFTPLKSPKLR